MEGVESGGQLPPSKYVKKPFKTNAGILKHPGFDPDFCVNVLISLLIP